MSDVNRTDRIVARDKQLRLLEQAGALLREAEGLLRRASTQALIVHSHTPGAKYGPRAEQQYAAEVQQLRTKVRMLLGRRAKEGSAD